jgi:hypothetical protein
MADVVLDANVIVGEKAEGKLNFNDALLVVLQRAGIIEEVAAFDTPLASQAGFRAFS